MYFIYIFYFFFIDAEAVSLEWKKFCFYYFTFSARFVELLSIDGGEIGIEFYS